MTSRPQPAAAIAGEVLAGPAPRLVVLDCDGVLAPIVPHAADSVLAPGVAAALDALRDVDSIRLAVLSGRSLGGLAQFSFPAHVELVGSYGAERRGRSPVPLTAVEHARLRRADELLVALAGEAGDGAWVERKPASAVLHVREADGERGTVALRRAAQGAGDLEGVFVHHGDQVVELMVRPADKGSALATLLDEFRPATALYAGDDVPDEAAFAVLDGWPGHAVTVKVGTAPSVAGRRLRGPDEVVELLRALGTSSSTV